MKARRNKKRMDRASEIEVLLASTEPVAKSLKKLKAAPLDLDSDPGFVADFIKARFIEDVLRVMEETGVNKNQLAGRMGKSRQYVGKMLNERTNFTVETMAEVACALGCRLAVRLAGRNERIAILPPKAKPAVVRRKSSGRRRFEHADAPTQPGMRMDDDDKTCAA
jgi:transcriptional regulator with XRE-family HTH domain